MLTSSQAVALRTCIELGGKIAFTRSFLSGKSIGNKKISSRTAMALAGRGFGTALVGIHKDEGTFKINPSGVEAYRLHRESVEKENQNAR